MGTLIVNNTRKYFPVQPWARFQQVMSSNFGSVTNTETTINTGSGFRGSVLLPDGRIFLIPTSGGNAKIYNPYDNSVFTASLTGVFYNGCLLPDGRVFCTPADTGNAYIYNPKDNSAFMTSLVAGGAGFWGCTLMVDGRVFVFGRNNNSVIYNLNNDTVTGLPSGLNYTGIGTLLPDGRILCPAESSTQRVRIYNPSDNTFFTSALSDPGNYSSCLLPDGRVYLAGRSQHSIYDPQTDTQTLPPPDNNVGDSVILMGDGRVFLVPLNSNAKIYDPVLNTYTNAVLSGIFRGATLMPDGRVLCVVDYGSNCKIYGDPTGNKLPMFYLLSAYINRS